MAIALDADLGETAAATGTSTTIAQAMTGPAAAGSRIFCVAGQFGTIAPAATPVTGGSLTWVLDFPAINASDNTRFHVYSADCPAGLTATTITHTWASAAAARTIALLSFTGVATGSSGYLTGTPVQSHAFSGGTPWATGNITPGVGEALLFAAVLADGAAGATATVTAPATKVNDVFNSGTTQELLTAYRVVTGDGSTAFSIAGTFGTAPGEDEEAIVGYQAGAAAPDWPPAGSENAAETMRVVQATTRMA